MQSIRIASFSALVVIGIASTAQAEGSAIGRYEYVSSCASCHGPAGKGDGPVAQTLKRTPADLTRLSEANKGVFPFTRTYDVIDGRFDVLAHGPRDMPVWVNLLQISRISGNPPGNLPIVSQELSESIVRARILALIEYLSTLQGK
jgi:mono/diheme cytochrome c family protein